MNYPGGTSFLAFQFFSNGTVGYELQVRIVSGAGNLYLYKMDGTLIQAGTVTHAGVLLGVLTTVSLWADGLGNIVADFSGERQITVSGETTYTSGTKIGFAGQNIAGDFYLPNAYSSRSIRFTGLPASTPMHIRAPAALPWDTATVAADGTLSYTSTTYPLGALENVYALGSDIKAPERCCAPAPTPTWPIQCSRRAAGFGRRDYARRSAPTRLHSADAGGSTFPIARARTRSPRSFPTATITRSI